MLGPAIQQLSRGFTGHRNLVGKTYLDDPDLLGAYLLFYWPVSYAQAWTVLSDHRRRLGRLDLQRVADLGSGPGPLVCAMIDMARDQQSDDKKTFMKIQALDHSPQALALLTELTQVAYGSGTEAGFQLGTTVWNASQGGKRVLPLDGEFDCISSGHFINELWNDLAPAQTLARRALLLEAAAKNLRPATPAFLMVLEPALKPTTRVLLGLRDSLVASGFPILGPCFFQGACPALATADGTCHGQVFWEVPGLIRRLAAVARVSKDELAMAWLTVGAPGARPPVKGEGRDSAVVPQRSEERSAAGPAGGEGFPPPGSDNYRVTGEALLNKAGRTRYMICGLDGRTSLSLKKGELLAVAPEGRGRKRIQELEDRFFGLRRGDAIRIQAAVPRESGLGMGPETKIELY